MGENEATRRRVCRLAPCPSYDVEGMESWLSELAQEGLLLEPDGFFAGLAFFSRARALRSPLPTGSGAEEHQPLVRKRAASRTRSSWPLAKSMAGITWPSEAIFTSTGAWNPAPGS